VAVLDRPVRAAEGNRATGIPDEAGLFARLFDDRIPAPEEMWIGQPLLGRPGTVRNSRAGRLDDCLKEREMVDGRWDGSRRSDPGRQLRARWLMADTAGQVRADYTHLFPQWEMHLRMHSGWSPAPSWST
jgi:hypothetical protein